MKKIIALIVLIIINIFSSKSQENRIVPTFEEVLSLKVPGTPIISPDGSDIVFTVNQTDWKENRTDTEIWISLDGGDPFQFTNNPTSGSSSPEWSPDGRWIAFISDRGNKPQVYVIRPEGGEAFPLTRTKEGTGQFEWSPDGRTIAFTTLASESSKKREERYGKYAVEDDEYRLSVLKCIGFNPELLGFLPLPCYELDSLKKDETCFSWPEEKSIAGGDNYTITGFKWSPDGKMIAIDHQPDPLITSSSMSDISIVYFESGKIEEFVSNPASDRFLDWAPDSRSILYTSDVDNTTSNYYTNSRYFRIDTDRTGLKELAAGFDENLSGLTWTSKGIYATAYQKTVRYLFMVNPDNGKVKSILTTPSRISGFTISKSGDRIAFNGSEDESLPEIYIAELSKNLPRKLSGFTKQIDNWKYAKSEVISWKSKDGTTIEGVLFKPYDYDPTRKYPLLLNIHGGPTGISYPTPVPAYVYPVLQWLDKGALVLMPNYRGSAGYGEEFRKLNVENLGVGDAWDVLSGVEFLDSKGMIDTDRMGAMGWSQGGYISAFLTTNSNIFRAISVGAGISNWMTYYVNTDIHPFTRQYLKATPWENEEIYRKTSPMTNINNATTPTLIQHGEFDTRVPVPNAYELYQGLLDVGVETKLVIYKGFGHGITKPKERLAAMWHNWQWFGKYIWGENIELPTN